MIATTTQEIDEYLRKATLALGDLTPEQRQALLDEIRHILHEVTAEIDGDPESLLGPPNRFVSELRSAAGYGAPASHAITPRPSLLELVRRWGLRTLNAIRELVRALIPAWPVVRGYLLSFAPTVLIGGPTISWLGLIPVPTSSPALGVSLVIVGIVGSVRLSQGRRDQRTRQILVAAITALAILSFVSLASDAKNGTLDGSSVISHPDQEPLVSPYAIPTTTAFDGLYSSDAESGSFRLFAPDERVLEAGVGDLLGLWNELLQRHRPDEITVVDPSGAAWHFSAESDLAALLERFGSSR